MRSASAARLLALAVAVCLGLARGAVAEDTPEPTKLTEAELATLVGPIALYPDIVIASLLPATSAPLDVVDAARALEKAGGTLAEVPAGSTWDASVEALIQVPDVLLWMNQNLEWVKQMGYAVAVQQADVLAAIQAFRRHADAAGNLKSDAHLTVAVETVPAEGGATTAAGATEVIVLAPTDPTVIYVPTYSPTAVVVPGYAGWAFGVGVVVGLTGAWAYHNIHWGHHHHGHDVVVGGSIHVSNTVNFNGSIDAVGVNRPAPWNPGRRPTTRPPGPVARPNQPDWNERPGAGRPGQSAGVRPRPKSDVPTARPTPAPLPARGPAGEPNARPQTQPARSSGGFGGLGSGAATREASERGSGSLRSAPGGDSFRGQGGRSTSSGAGRDGGRGARGDRLR